MPRCPGVPSGGTMYIDGAGILKSISRISSPWQSTQSKSPYSSASWPAKSSCMMGFTLPIM